MRLAIGVLMVTALGTAGWYATRPEPPPVQHRPTPRFDWPPSELRVTITPAAGASFKALAVRCPLKQWNDGLVWVGVEETGLAVRVALAGRDEGESAQGHDAWEVSVGPLQAWASALYRDGVSFRLRGLDAFKAGLGLGKFDVEVQESRPARPSRRRPPPR
jgi:hypothetical protein